VLAKIRQHVVARELWSEDLLFERPRRRRLWGARRAARKDHPRIPSPSLHRRAHRPNLICVNVWVPALQGGPRPSRHPARATPRPRASVRRRSPLHVVKRTPRPRQHQHHRAVPGRTGCSHTASITSRPPPSFPSGRAGSMVGAADRAATPKAPLTRPDAGIHSGGPRGDRPNEQTMCGLCDDSPNRKLAS
jgi:hypothetical protein